MKEKVEQIFNAMADITLKRLERCKEAEDFGTREIQMVSATLQMYHSIADNHQPELFQ